MKASKAHLVPAIVVIAVAMLACKWGGIGTVNITNAHTARDEADTDKTNVFSSTDTTVYCFLDLNNAPSDTNVKGVLSAVEAEGLDPNYVIGQVDITTGDPQVHFSFERGSDTWPPGKYKIDLYLNDKLVQTLDFQVK